MSKKIGKLDKPVAAATPICFYREMQRRKINIALGLLTLCVPAFAIAAEKAEVFVVGAIHNLHRSATFSEFKFQQILETIEPDLILLEFPPEWFDANGNPDQDLKNSLEDEYQKDGIRDGQLAWKHCMQRAIPCNPFDIRGRNEFFKKHRVFERLDVFNREIQKYVEFRPSQRAALRAFEKLHGECLNASPEVLNGKVCDEAAKSQEEFIFQLYREARRKNEIKDRNFYQLQKNFWDLRNKVMAKNICGFSMRNPGKKIAVITGVDHHYYLVDLLSKCAGAELRQWF